MKTTRRQNLLGVAFVGAVVGESTEPTNYNLTRGGCMRN
jgi:hypothetical protein